MRSAALFLILFVLLILTPQASAQSSEIGKPAISVERLLVEPGPGTLLGAHAAEVLEPGRWQFGVLASLMTRPIVLRDLRSGDEALVPVSVRLGYALSFAIGMTERFQLGFALPVVAAQDGDRLQGIGLSDESLTPLALGDIRVHAKLRLNESNNQRLRYGLSIYLALPSGNENHFSGEAASVLSWTMLASYHRSNLTLVANLGLRIRTQETVLLSPARPHGNEIISTVATEYRLPAAMDFPVSGLLEISKVYGDNSGPSPGEARVGVRAFVLPRAGIKLVYGRGFTPNEVGAPAWRVAAAFEYKSQ